jgi:hypothetical protein
MNAKTLETNCRPASPLDGWRQFGRSRASLRLRQQSLTFAFDMTPHHS